MPVSDPSGGNGPGRWRDEGYPLGGFSPSVMKLLADAFGRHGDDIDQLTRRLKRKVASAADSDDAARDLAELCLSFDRISERLKADAVRALVEAQKLEPGRSHRTLCGCGRTIEDGQCPTGGRCARGLEIDIRS